MHMLYTITLRDIFPSHTTLSFIRLGLINTFSHSDRELAEVINAEQLITSVKAIFVVTLPFFFLIK